MHVLPQYKSNKFEGLRTGVEMELPLLVQSQVVLEKPLVLLTRHH